MSTSTALPSQKPRSTPHVHIVAPKHPSVVSRSLADILHELGDVEASRVRSHRLGKATVSDVVKIHDREGRLFELVDGVLVEKAMGFRESFLASSILILLHKFAADRKLGIVLGADTMMQLFPNLVRMPDVSFFSWERMKNKIPTEAVPLIAPNLAIEVLSPSNTKKEMERKRGEYFKSGVQIVWMVDPKTRTVAVYESAESFKLLSESETITGGSVLPGFTLLVKEIFAIPEHFSAESENSNE